jgi:hypothetical protein
MNLKKNIVNILLEKVLNPWKSTRGLYLSMQKLHNHCWYVLTFVCICALRTDYSPCNFIKVF